MTTISRDPEKLAPYLADESRMPGGHAEEIAWPTGAEEAAEQLAEWDARGLPVTVSGGGTGLVGGRVPLGGAVLATDRMARVLGIEAVDEESALMTVQAGASLSEVQQAAAAEGWLYPPDPTEAGSFIGGNLATNASGARSFRFGATRAWIDGLTVALADGRLLHLQRSGTPGSGAGESIALPERAWRAPRTTKSTTGYYASRGADFADLLIGSEGTLCVFLEARLRLIRAPVEMLSGLLFFGGESAAFAFSRRARGDRRNGEQGVRPWSLELFGEEALTLLREQGVALPRSARAAIFFEEGIAPHQAGEATGRWDGWLRLAEDGGALADSWLGDGAADDRRFREFRHAIPTGINEKLARRGVQKVSTDTAVPPGRAEEMIAAFRRRLDEQGYERVVFGHVGDDHVHLNVLPRGPEEEPGVRQAFWDMISIATAMGGTVAAEHGLGKLKSRGLELQFDQGEIAAMRAVKRALDPGWRLGRGTLFPPPAESG